MRCRTDANQKLIVDAARRAGLRVYDTSMVGKGFGDLVVQYGRITECWEVKDPAKPPSQRKFTQAQTRSRELGLFARLVLTLDDVLQARKEMIANATVIENSRRLNEW